MATSDPLSRMYDDKPYYEGLMMGAQLRVSCENRQADLFAWPNCERGLVYIRVVSTPISAQLQKHDSGMRDQRMYRVLSMPSVDHGLQLAVTKMKKHWA